jgi:hypothetical protein
MTRRFLTLLLLVAVLAQAAQTAIHADWPAAPAASEVSLGDSSDAVRWTPALPVDLDVFVPALLLSAGLLSEEPQKRCAAASAAPLAARAPPALSA